MKTVLAIETTCDETAVAVVEGEPPGPGLVLAQALRSQAAQHADFGGVVPELAARAHVEYLDGLIRQSLTGANMGFPDLDAIAVSAGPGLIGSLMVGVATARALAMAADKPMLAINHLAGHALSTRLESGTGFPFLALILSGGHSEFVAIEAADRFTCIGRTLDDAAGEAFDKIARLIGLNYPGGAAIEAKAARGNPQRYSFPRPMYGRPDPDLSFSGLKTAVRLEVERLPTFPDLSEQQVADLSASFQATMVATISDRTYWAIERFQSRFGVRPGALVVAGGVAANAAIRDALVGVCARASVSLAIPDIKLCGDNAAMIGWAGIERLYHGGTGDPLDLSVFPRWPLEDYSQFLATVTPKTGLRHQPHRFVSGFDQKLC